VLEAIQEGIDFVNKKATSNAQRIQKWSILRRDFSVWGTELGQFSSLIVIVNESLFVSMQKTTTFFVCLCVYVPVSGVARGDSRGDRPQTSTRKLFISEYDAIGYLTFDPDPSNGEYMLTPISH